jgi:hypothetical protein
MTNQKEFGIQFSTHMNWHTLKRAILNLNSFNYFDNKELPWNLLKHHNDLEASLCEDSIGTILRHKKSYFESMEVIFWVKRQFCVHNTANFPICQQIQV